MGARFGSGVVREVVVVRALFVAVALFTGTAVFEDAPVEAPAKAPAEIASVDLPAELDRVLRDYEKAWAAKDAKALAALFTDDGFVLQDGAPPVRGRDAIEAAYTGLGGPLSLRAFAFAVDGDLGTILGGYTHESGAPDSGKFTLTLRRAADGRYAIVSDMDNANHRRR
ncbi:MAG: SgcJ/EcaC family oxidoreductase [Planctomycetes bacterium]|nr:SgcJ/EcaC family oxidoreductase [Planctomycetota bacterium]